MGINFVIGFSYFVLLVTFAPCFNVFSGVIVSTGKDLADRSVRVCTYICMAVVPRGILLLPCMHWDRLRHLIIALCGPFDSPCAIKRMWCSGPC